MREERQTYNALHEKSLQLQNITWLQNRLRHLRLRRHLGQAAL